MGNPCRYFFQNKFSIRRPTIDKEKKEVKIETAYSNFLNHSYLMPGQEKFADFYETARIDFYSAPDVIMTYSNGNTCKDEFCRYSRWTFKNLQLISLEELIEECITATYKFVEANDQWFNINDVEMEMDIPLGKFRGMTYEQVQNYKRKNRLQFKGEKLKPSKEAVDAAYKTQTWPPLGHEDVETMLMAAYEIDM